MIKFFPLLIALFCSCHQSPKNKETYAPSPTTYKPLPKLTEQAIYVKLHTDANGDGSIEKPYSSIATAIEKSPEGSTIYLREGKYQELIQVKNSDKKITIAAYPGEKVIIDGTKELSPQWKHYKNNIYRTPVESPVWQLFVNEQYSYLARWPNATFENGKIWRMTQGMRSLNGGYKSGQATGKSRLGLAYDDSFKSHDKNGFNEGDSRYSESDSTLSLADSGLDFTNSIAVLNIGHWLTWARPITKHKVGSDHFSYNSQGISLPELHQHTAYYIYGLAALDQNNEWWYDKDKKFLYYKAKDKQSLDQLKFTTRKVDFMLELSNVKNISFENIDFFAAGYNVKSCENIQFKNCRFDYLSDNKYVLGKFDWFTAFNGNTNNQMSSFFGGKNNQIINCIFSRCNAPIIFRSENTLVENCLFEDIEWDVNTNGGSGSVMIGKGSTIRHCTLSKTGNSEGIRALEDSCTIQYNRVFDAGNLQHDGSGINVGTKVQKGAIVSHNWVHDCNRQGVRFDYHGMNVFQKDGSVYGDGLYAFNVIWNTQPSQVKGDRHLIFNNTIVSCNYFPDPSNEPFNFSIQGFKAMHGIMGNEHSIIRNNLANISHRSWDLRIIERRTENYKNGVRLFKDLNYNVLPGVHDHNMKEAGAAYKYLRDPQNLDFRPQLKSPLIAVGKNILAQENPSKYTSLNTFKELQKTMDIGAYQSQSTKYWIPGYKSLKSSQAIPLDQGEVTSLKVDLMFLEAYQASSHKVYFGTSPTKLKLIRELSASNICPSPLLQAGQKYFWRVDAIYPDGISSGPTWSFSVK
ncbi:right-handed parallel beta-helix repeat-containing protein [Lentisphaera marina]|uniref:right-handed parallel beta-helix repeat-containing protein n=1 Tax=Lentisphaera marina TaxID=1111041 RepID=UPI002365D93E|nr:right-handed parallel beta-helix repeat-containing protein [Lentisphaera marina]MDD7984598.1 right-handed parallel beta-helix repeat-containing protein [Lentisphaera marina]